MNQKTKIAYLSAVVLALALGVATFAAIAKNDNAKAQSQGKGKTKTVNLKNFEKPDKNKGTTNAQINKVKTDAVVQNLEQVATKEKSTGNTKVSDQIQQVVTEQVQTQPETTDAITQVENRGRLAKFIFGPEFKNLGQLRSSLVHNRNEIRKLTQTLNSLTAAAGTLPAGTDTTVTATGDTPTIDAITAQLVILEQERQRLRTIIYDRQDTFSLFGWLTKIMTGYTSLPADDPAETALTTEVETAINNTATVTTTTGTTDTTPPAQ